MQCYKLVATMTRITAICLLLFNGVGAVYGGLNLAIYPDGSSIHLDPALLAHTPFHSYLIPGIVLFLSNGILSLAVLVTIITKRSGYYRYIVLQGVVLLGWLIVQMLLIRKIDVLHYVMGVTGIALVVCGLIIRNCNLNLRTSGY